MAIKFPSVHIAASVQNRILNLRDELNGTAQAPAPAVPVAPPIVTDPAPASAELDARVTEPVPEDVPELEPQPPAADELGELLARGDNLIS